MVAASNEKEERLERVARREGEEKMMMFSVRSFHVRHEWNMPPEFHSRMTRQQHDWNQSRYSIPWLTGMDFRTIFHSRITRHPRMESGDDIPFPSFREWNARTSFRARIISDSVRGQTSNNRQQDHPHRRIMLLFPQYRRPRRNDELVETRGGPGTDGRRRRSWGEYPAAAQQRPLIGK